MNHTYRVVWQESTRTWVAAAETVRGRRKGTCALAAVLLLVAGSAFGGIDPNTLPTGYQLKAGAADAAKTVGNAMVIDQKSLRAVYGWDSFNVGSNASVYFKQTGANAVAMNLIGGNEASQIYGKLRADGQVFLMNPNGVVFAPGARIDVGGLLTTTMNMNPDDFMNGDYRLSGAGSGTIRNEGLIKAAGSVVLVGNTVENAGTITAASVTLAAGSAVAIDLTGDGLIRARVDNPALRSRLENEKSGSITATLAVTMTAGEAKNALDSLVNNSGIVRATGLASRGGEIFLEGAQVTHSGTIEVANGGRIDLRADDVLVASAGSHTSADGGSIRLWSDHDTFAHGSFSARRGFIETSGKYVDVRGIAIDAPGGTWLIDPTDITIGNGSSNPCTYSAGTCSVAGATSIVDASSIATLLSAGTDVTIDTASAGGSTGKIDVSGAISMNAASSGTTATLTLNADAGIDFYWLNGTIGSTNGKLNIVLNANRTSHGAGTGVTSMNSGATFSTNGGNFTASGDNLSMAGGTINTSGGNISLTAGSTTANGYGIGLSWGTLNSGGGKISLLSNNGITFGNTIVNAGSSFISMNPAASGLANNGNGAIGGTLITSGLELLGGANATYTSPSGAYIYAPGAIQSATAQSNNPTVTLAGDIGSISAFYLNRAASGNTWATDLVIGALPGMTVSGLNAHGGNVLLGTYNGNILQTAPITNVNQLTVNSMAGAVDGNSIALTNTGNSVATLVATAYDDPAGTAPTIPVLQFVNGGALSISYAYSGKGALDIRTTTGNLTIPVGSYVRSDYSGSAGNIVNAIVLAAGTTTPAYFVSQNINGYLTGYSSAVLDNSSGTYSRFLVYSKDVTGTNLGAYTYTTANRRFETYYGATFYNPGSATPISTDIPTTNNHGSYNTYGNAFVFQTAPTLTVTTNAASRNYGDANPAFTYSTSGLAMSDTIGVALTGTLSSGATAASGAGSYTINGGLSSPTGYSLGFTGGTLTVSPRSVSVAANAATKTYGGADPAFTYSVTGGNLVNGDVLSLTRAAGENVGTYAINLGSNTNYNVTYTGNDLTINPAAVAVAVAEAVALALGIGADNKSKTYGSADPALTWSLVSGALSNGDQLSGALARDAGENVGDYAIRQGTLSAGANYTINFTNGLFRIAPATLTVAANEKSKIYGSADPVFNYTVSGLVRNASLGIADTAASVLSGTLARARGETVAGGPYAIGQGSLAANGNYTLAFVGNHLTINPAALTVIANEKTKPFGSADPLFDYKVGQLVNNADLGIADTEASVLSGALDRAPGETVAGGPYAIGQGSLAASGNYRLTFVGNSLSIAPSPAAESTAAIQSVASPRAAGDATPGTDADADSTGPTGATPSAPSGQDIVVAQWIMPKAVEDVAPRGRGKGRALVCRGG